jgi:hypothetical protein
MGESSLLGIGIAIAIGHSNHRIKFDTDADTDCDTDNKDQYSRINYSFSNFAQPFTAISAVKALLLKKGYPHKSRNNHFFSNVPLWFKKRA